MKTRGLCYYWNSQWVDREGDPIPAGAVVYPDNTYDIPEDASKPANPKDIIGSKKLDVGNVPDSLVIGAAAALLEGALKYGRFSWRQAGVIASIYHAACRRHLTKWWNGQDYDKATRVHHLDSAIASLAILRDAELYNKLTDDRPPCPDPDAMAELVDAAERNIAHLREMFKDANPYQYSIKDTPRHVVK